MTSGLLPRLVAATGGRRLKHRQQRATDRRNFNAGGKQHNDGVKMLVTDTVLHGSPRDQVWVVPSAILPYETAGLGFDFVVGDDHPKQILVTRQKLPSLVV